MAMNGMPTCTLCGRREAFYYRPYSGEMLCRRCFRRTIEDKVRATIAKYRMFKPDDRIAVGVSGGKDSVTLLHILAKIEQRFPKSELVAITVDEGIRGYRDEALEIARENCRMLRVEHVIVSFKEMFGYRLDEIVEITRPGKGLAPCSYCGVLRRKALNLAAREVGADKLATAHTLDDEVQTMLLNIFHGDATRIVRVKPVLTPAHPRLVPRVKPFCEVLEREVTLYAYLLGIRFQSVPCPYAPTALRNDIRNVLNRMEERHPGIKYTIYRAIQRIQPILEAHIPKVQLRECRLCGEPTVGEVCKACQMIQQLNALTAKGTEQT